MKKTLLVILLLSLLSMDLRVRADRADHHHKSEMDIGIQLKGSDKICATCSDTVEGQLYYLTVQRAVKKTVCKNIRNRKDRYGMQLYYIETWDPVYGFKCNQPIQTGWKPPEIFAWSSFHAMKRLRMWASHPCANICPFLSLHWFLSASTMYTGISIILSLNKPDSRQVRAARACSGECLISIDDSRIQKIIYRSQ